MAETNINAYKQELVEAELAVDQAQARIDSLKAHIDLYGTPEEVVVEDVPVVVEVVKPSKKGK